jgi:hypothetical protein
MFLLRSRPPRRHVDCRVALRGTGVGFTMNEVQEEGDLWGCELSNF